MQQLTQSFFSQNCLCICRTTDYGRLFQGGIEVDREKGIRYLTKQCYIRLSQIYRLVIHCIKLECFIVARKFMMKVIILSPGFFLDISIIIFNLRISNGTNINSWYFLENPHTRYLLIHQLTTHLHRTELQDIGHIKQ